MTKHSDQVSEDDFISGLSSRKQHILAIAILLILPVILFNASVFGGKKILGHDTVQWRAGAESIFEHQEEYGEAALWATNMFSGMPAYVIKYDKAVYHIDQLIRSVFDPVFPVAQFWVLLIGCYLFFILQGARPLTAVLGSVFIGFTTYIPIIIGAGHNTKFYAYTYIPWIFSGYWLMTKTSRRLLGFFLFTLAFTLEFRANHPQVTYYFLYLLAFWWMFDTYRAYKKQTITEWSKITGLLILAGVLAILSNLQPYWSMMEYTPYTIRGGSALRGDGGLDLEYAFSWSQGFGELLTLIIPGIFGGSSSEAYWGLKPGTSGPHYFGAIAFVLALMGLVLYKNKRKYVFLGTGVLTMLFSLGYHFPLLNELMFRYVPYFNKFRTPEMWLIVTVFCFAVLAVYGVDSFIDLVRAKRSKALKELYLPLGVAIGIGIIFTLGSDALLSFENQQQRNMIAQQIAQQNNLSPDNPQVQQYASRYINTQLKPERKEMAGSDSTRYLILVLLAGGLIFAFYKKKIGTGAFLLGLIALAAYDLISIGSRYTNEEAMVRQDITPARYIEAQRQPADNFVMEHIESNEGYPYRVFPLDRNPFNNAVPSYFYPTIGGYTGAKISYYQDLIDQLLFAGPQGIHTEILHMLNVKYLTASTDIPLPGFEQVYNENNQRVFENTQVLPKAFFVDSVVTAESAAEAVNLMKPEAGFDASEYAIVETDEPVSSTTDTTAEVQVLNYNAREIQLHTSRSEPGFLVLSEIYYPEGWKATIDGEETPIYKTNYVLRGIEVPAGEHTVTFSFNPASHTWGSRIAWAGNLIQLGIGLFILALWYRGREEKNIEPENKNK